MQLFDEMLAIMGYLRTLSACEMEYWLCYEHVDFEDVTNLQYMCIYNTESTTYILRSSWHTNTKCIYSPQNPPANITSKSDYSCVSRLLNI